jgi:ACS family hexuronate transporter-like MFS transporter
MSAAAALTPFSVLAAYATSAEMAIAFMSLLMLAHGFWITNYVTLISESFTSRSVSTVMGFAGAIGGIGGYLATLITGPVVDQFSFLPIWIASGCMYPAALAVLFFTVNSEH